MHAAGFFVYLFLFRFGSHHQFVFLGKGNKSKLKYKLLFPLLDMQFISIAQTISSWDYPFHILGISFLEEILELLLLTVL